VWLFPLNSNNKHVVYLFKYIAGLLTYLTFKKSGKVLMKKSIIISETLSSVNETAWIDIPF